MIIGTKADQLPKFVGSIPDEQIIIVPDPITGELFRTTFGQIKADLILAVGDITWLDQIIEVDQIVNLPSPGEIKKIYVITGTGPDQNKQFRWGGSVYIEFPAGSGDVAGEAIIRGNADLALHNRIDTEIQDRENADDSLQQNINAEAIARQNGDNSLLAQISAEANTRATNDSILQGLLNAEAVIRAAADLALNQRIDDLNLDGKGITFAVATTPVANYYQASAIVANAYIEGIPYLIKIPATNTDVPYLIVGTALSARPIKRRGGGAVLPGELKQDAILLFVYVDVADGYYAVDLGEGGDIAAEIDDTTPALDKVYSSHKTQLEIDKIAQDQITLKIYNASNYATL